MEGVVFALVLAAIVFGAFEYDKRKTARFQHLREKHVRQGFIDGLDKAKHVGRVDQEAANLIDAEIAKQQKELVLFLHRTGLEPLT